MTPVIQWIPDCFPPGRNDQPGEDDQSAQSSAKVKTGCNFTSTLHIPSQYAQEQLLPSQYVGGPPKIFYKWS